jgi:hypothetical protein
MLFANKRLGIGRHLVNGFTRNDWRADVLLPDFQFPRVGITITVFETL